MRLPWRGAAATSADAPLQPHVQLPDAQQNVELRLRGGERLHARVTERGDDELVVLIMVPASRALTPERLHDVVLETSGPRGVARLAGEAAIVDRDMLRLFGLHPLDLVQRRENVRVQTRRPVVLRQGSATTPHETSTVDISGGGMLISGARHLRVGDYCHFTLTTYPDKDPITGSATVVRKLSGDRCALSFTDISEGNERRLVRFLFDLQREERQRGLILDEDDG